MKQPSQFAIIMFLLFYSCFLSINNAGAQGSDTTHWTTLMQNPYRIVVSSSLYFNGNKDTVFNTFAEIDLLGLVDFLKKNPERHVEIAIPNTTKRKTNTRNMKRLHSIGAYIVKQDDEAKNRINISISGKRPDSKYSNPNTIVFVLLR
jgi:hypothetical protein